MNINNRIIHLPVEWFTNSLHDGKPFSFARYGDGEWRAIIGGKYLGLKNSNGCTFSEKLSNALRTVLRNNKPYMHGILRIAINQHRKEIEQYILKNDCKVDWYKGDKLLEESLKGNIFPFVRELRERRLLMVGQQFLRELGPMGFFKPVTFVHTPPSNAIEHKKEILGKIRSTINQYNIDTILWSSGLHTKVFIDDLYDDIGNGITMIDCGSMWDGYMRIPSRTYIRRGHVDWDGLVAVNTGKRKKIKGEQFRI
jgi:hypothetical protein